MTITVQSVAYNLNGMHEYYVYKKDKFIGNWDSREQNTSKYIPILFSLIKI